MAELDPTRSLPPGTPSGDASPDAVTHTSTDSSADRTHSFGPPVEVPPVSAIDIPGYEVLGEVGRGGMGVVYRARQVELNRPVAVKVLLGAEHADPKGLVRFLAEAEAVAAVRHPHVVQVYEFGTHRGWPYLAMEYLPGDSLAERLKAGGAVPPREAAALVGKVAEAVRAAHELGIVHRDLKPANVMFDDRGEPRVVDFGLAKRGSGGDLTRTYAVMGTPAYMAPEQVRGNAKLAGPAADVWSLGVILYQCLTGSRPFDAEDDWGVFEKVQNARPARPRKIAPQVPKDLEAICLKCLRKEPADRYPTAAGLADDLRRFLGGEPVSARPVTRLERAYKWARRKPALAAACVLAGLAVGLGGLAMWQWQRAEDDRMSSAAAGRDGPDTPDDRPQPTPPSADPGNPDDDKQLSEVAPADRGEASGATGWLRFVAGYTTNDETFRKQEWRAARPLLVQALRLAPRHPRVWHWQFALGVATRFHWEWKVKEGKLTAAEQVELADDCALAAGLVRAAEYPAIQVFQLGEKGGNPDLMDKAFMTTLYSREKRPHNRACLAALENAVANPDLTNAAELPVWKLAVAEVKFIQLEKGAVPAAMKKDLDRLAGDAEKALSRLRTGDRKANDLKALQKAAAEDMIARVRKYPVEK